MVSSVLGVWFLNESSDTPKVCGVAMIRSAIALLHFKRVPLEKSHFYGLLGSLLFGIVYTLDKSAVLLVVQPVLYTV